METKGKSRCAKILNIYMLSKLVYRKFRAYLSDTERRRILEERRRISEKEEAGELNVTLFLKFCFFQVKI